MAPRIDDLEFIPWSSTTIATVGGTSLKRQVELDGERWILKFVEDFKKRRRHPSGTGHKDSPVSEWLGCHVFAFFDVPVQETRFVNVDGCLTVACRDFRQDFAFGETTVPFRTLLQSYSFHNGPVRNPPRRGVLETLRDCVELEPIREEAVSAFWQMVAVDAIIGNYNRHDENWEYVVDGRTRDLLRPAPVFDCGSSYLSAMSDEARRAYAEDIGKLNARIALEPRTCLKADGRAVSHMRMLYDCLTPSETEIVADICERSTGLDILELAHAIPGCTDEIARFYDIVSSLNIYTNLQPVYAKVCSMRGLKPSRLIDPNRYDDPTAKRIFPSAAPDRETVPADERIEADGHRAIRA